MPNYVSERNGSPQTGSQGVSGSGQQLPPLTGHASQISWALQIRKQIGLAFDQITVSVSTGINRYKSLEPTETAILLGVIEEHREKVLAATDSQYFLDHWQDPADRVQRLIHADVRWLAVVEARSARHARSARPEPAVPVRYMGFDDNKGVRIFKFGRLPAGPSTPIHTVQVSVELLLKHGISFQDAPAMCCAIMAAGEPADHHLTDEDCVAFIALRPVKAERKPPRKKAASAED